MVQEYFQTRVTLWLNTVGKRVFGIDHYWVRYEFAPGRGQIHAHLLAISNDQSIYSLCHEARKQEDGEKLRAQWLAQWASSKFGLSATVSEDFESIEVNNENSPVRMRFTDIEPSNEARTADFNRMRKHVMYHQCSGFCLREYASCKE